MGNIYENIRRLRESKGLSQDDLAKLTGYTSRSSIAKIEKGLVDLQQSKIIAFAKALEVTPNELMGLSEAAECSNMSLDYYEYTVDEIAEIKKFAEFIKNNRKKKRTEQHFVDAKKAFEYLKQETSRVAAFDGGTLNEEVILQMANAVYLNRNNK